MRKPWYLRGADIVWIDLDTRAGKAGASELSLPVSLKWAGALIRRPENTHAYRPSCGRLLLFSVAASHSFAGILLLVTGIHQAGRILGPQLSASLYGQLEALARWAAFGIPPAAAAFGYLILLGWLTTLYVNLLGYDGFSVFRTGGTLWIRSGRLTRRQIALRTANVAFLDIRRTVLTQLAGYASAFASYAGRGGHGEKLAVIVPAEKSGCLDDRLRQLLWELTPDPLRLRRPDGAILRYLGAPGILLCALPIAETLLCLWLPGAAAFLRFFTRTLSLPVLWYGAVGLLDYQTTGFSYQNGRFTLRCARGFYLHTYVIPAQSVSSLQMTQSLLQRRRGLCDLTVEVCLKNRRLRHTVHLLDLRTLCTFLELPAVQPGLFHFSGPEKN
jgi:uncharacterized membrane protein YdbT with pleckstrin-like domain